MSGITPPSSRLAAAQRVSGSITPSPRGGAHAGAAEPAVV